MWTVVLLTRVCLYIYLLFSFSTANMYKFTFAKPETKFIYICFELLIAKFKIVLVTFYNCSEKIQNVRYKLGHTCFIIVFENNSKMDFRNEVKEIHSFKTTVYADWCYICWCLIYQTGITLHTVRMCFVINESIHELFKKYVQDVNIIVLDTSTISVIIENVDVLLSISL